MASAKRFHLHQKENIHKTWNFKSMTPFGASFGMQKINLLDLSKKDSLVFLADDSKEPPIPYHTK